MAHGSPVLSSNSSDCATASAETSAGTRSKMSKLKVGDQVMWRGGFGRDAPQVATIAGMEVTD